MIKYVVFPGKTDYSKAIFSDLKNESSVLLEREFKSFTSKINKLHTSCQSNQFFRLPFQHIWYGSYIDYEKLDKENKLLFLLCEENRLCYDTKFIEYLRKRFPLSKIVFCPVNSVNTIDNKYHNIIFNCYDDVVTFDKRDSEKYGWLFYGRIFSHISIDMDAPIYDVFYIGSNSGRLPILHEVYRNLVKSGVKCNFFITDVKDDEKMLDSNIHYNKRLDYCEILNHVGEANCILEIIREGQSGSTLRFAEAIAFGKKLITNNKNVVFEKDYNSNQVLVFDKVSDINIDFIKKENKAMYSTRNSMAPIGLLEYVYEQCFGC